MKQEKFFYWSILGLLVFASGVGVMAFLGVRGLGVCIAFTGAFLFVGSLIRMVFAMDYEIDGKPAGAGIKTAVIGFAIAFSGIAMAFTPSDGLIALGYMLFAIGAIVMLIGIVIHMSYFF